MTSTARTEGEWNPLTRLGERVRALRLERGWNQAQLAARSQLHENQIWLLENGKRNPSAKTLFLIAAALDVRPSALFEGYTAADLKRLLSLERQVKLRRKV